MTDDSRPAMSASYQVKAPKPPRAASVAVAFAIAATLIALCAAALAAYTYTHPGAAHGSQAAQSRIADTSTRTARELSGASSQIKHLTAVVSQQAAEIAALKADAADTITCANLRHMNLTATTGASVTPDVGIDLDQSPVQLPGKCKDN